MRFPVSPHDYMKGKAWVISGKRNTWSNEILVQARYGAEVVPDISPAEMTVGTLMTLHIVLRIFFG